MPKKGLRNLLFFKHSPLPPSSTRRVTFSDSLMDENIETARSLITKWDPIPTSNGKTTTLFSNTREEAKQYINAVKRLQSAMQYLVAQDSSSEKLLQAQLLLQVAMKRLELEFYRILSENRDRLEPESVSSRSSTDRRSSVSDYDDEFSDDEFRLAAGNNSVSMVAMADLKAIAECVISAGYSEECVKIYIIVRKSIVDEALYHLRVERLSFSQVQKMDSEVLELKIKSWLNAIKVAVGTLFHGERVLCDHVFGSAENKIAESCFAEICRDGATYLFGFPENVAKCKKTPEKMFRTLDMYEAISDNLQQIESIFSFESTSTIRSQAVNSQVRLGEAVRAMLSDFESAIQKESSKIPVPGGGVHPLTRYVMNYIAFLADYSGVLAGLIADWPRTPLPESYYRSPNREEDKTSSEIAEQLAWLILVVLCKLDGKAGLYNDIALSYLFLANNMQYVVVKVRKSNLGFLFGEDWFMKHESKVKEYVSKYERVGWNKVLESLPGNPTAEMPAEQVRAIFESFNAAFDEACRAQSSWVVSDPKLRDKIKVSIASKLVPRYVEFYEKFRVGSESVIRYSPDDLGNNLSELLYGMEQSDSVSSHCRSPIHRLKRP
ncbi:exocyst complex component EXO70H1 [Gastrolobium bilobum]|uniref:exocyst complex component EXO70H1 n=1 Tax=Gastrolobium bilobum TaxID=150636 RepID=UPI002AB14A08|nr:exocyst complex component EXO70H1 [Gastrolobium bilobum]